MKTVGLLLLGLMLIGASPASVPSVMFSKWPATTQAVRFAPIHTVTQHALAMAGGDPEGVRRVYSAKNDAERAVVDAYAGVASAISRLIPIANDKFGDHGFELIGFGKMFSQEVARLTGAQTEMKGNEAYVYTGSKANPTVLVFEEGEWKISVAGTFKGDLTRRAKRIGAQTAAYNELAAEIKMGRYKDAAEARNAGSEKVGKAMAQVEKELAATTQASEK